MTDIGSLSINKRFDHLLTIMNSPRFLNKEGLNNEIPFYICPFPVEETVEMQKTIEQLKRQLTMQQIPVLEINLYLLSLEILNDRGLLQKMIAIEPKTNKQMLFNQITSLLDIEKYFVPKIVENLTATENKIVFITGVGEVFPFIRTHNILHNLQSVASETISLFFFPGKYNVNDRTGSNLSLFGQLDDKYYRAFNIYNCFA